MIPSYLLSLNHAFCLKISKCHSCLSMKVSLIIPTYNRSLLLEELLTSVVKQSYLNLEVIVVDNNSSENIKAVVERFATRFDNNGLVFRYLFCAEKGACHARNRGLREATGDAVIFIDSDDVLTRDGLRQLVYALKDTEHDMAYCKVLVTQMCETKNVGTPLGSNFDHRNPEYAGYHWHTMGALYRYELLERVGEWNTDLTGSQDWEYQARIKMHCKSPVFVDTIVGCFRQHDAERIGVNKFRYDYTASVVKACLSIAKHSLKNGVCGARLSLRLAKKLCLHALEFSQNGCEKAKIRTLYSIMSLAKLPVFFCSLFALFFISSRKADKLVYKLIQRCTSAQAQHMNSIDHGWSEHLPEQIC